MLKNPKFRDFENLKMQVYRRSKNLQDIQVKAAVPSSSKKNKTLKQCYNTLKCRYCPKIDKIGKIRSTVTKREYTTKTNVSCQSSNLIHCLTCKKCAKQYVGQTGRRLLERFQGHFSGISRKERSTLISDQLTSNNHNGTMDMTIHILDFVFQNPESDSAKKTLVKN